jgi:hypothetical protein
MAFTDPDGTCARIIAKQAYSHAVSLVIWTSDEVNDSTAPNVLIASAGLVKFANKICAVTCDHVLKLYEKKRERNSRTCFQIGSVVCDPSALTLDRDQAFDLAILDVTSLPIDRLSNRTENSVQPVIPVRWPSDPLNEGDFIVLCGFPIATR